MSFILNTLFFFVAVGYTFKFAVLGLETYLETDGNEEKTKAFIAENPWGYITPLLVIVFCWIMILIV